MLNKRNPKLISLLFFSLTAITIPQKLLGAFIVEEKRETPSEFAQQGVQTLNVVISAINVFLGLLFVSSLIGLIVAGVRFVIAGGSESMLDTAKTTSIASIIGLVFSLVGYIIVNTIKHFVI